jgi:hypothetical protein
MQDVPEHIKEFVLNKHNSEIRIAFIDGTINGMKCYRGEDLIDASDYYKQKFKGDGNG